MLCHDLRSPVLLRMLLVKLLVPDARLLRWQFYGPALWTLCAGASSSNNTCRPEHFHGWGLQNSLFIMVINRTLAHHHRKVALGCRIGRISLLCVKYLSPRHELLILDVRIFGDSLCPLVAFDKAKTLLLELFRKNFA